MPPIADSATSCTDAEVNGIYDAERGATIGHADSGAHTSALRAVFDRGMERGELVAWRAGDAAGKGRIIFLHQAPLTRPVFFIVDHIGSVSHNGNAERGSLVHVAGVSVPVDEEPHEILKMVMGQ